MRALLGLGADPAARSAGGRTALDVATTDAVRAAFAAAAGGGAGEEL